MIFNMIRERFPGGVEMEHWRKVGQFCSFYIKLWTCKYLLGCLTKHSRSSSISNQLNPLYNYYIFIVVFPFAWKDFINCSNGTDFSITKLKLWVLIFWKLFHVVFCGMWIWTCNLISVFVAAFDWYNCIVGQLAKLSNPETVKATRYLIKCKKKFAWFWVFYPSN